MVCNIRSNAVARSWDAKQRTKEIPRQIYESPYIYIKTDFVVTCFLVCFFHCVAFDSPIPHFEISSNMTPSNSKSLAGHTKPLFENEWFRMPATYAHNHATVHANGCTNRIHFTFCIYQKSEWNSNTLRTRLSGINFSNLWPSPFKRMCTLFVNRDV